jgi:hypothetical protein
MARRPPPRCIARSCARSTRRARIRGSRRLNAANSPPKGSPATPRFAHDAARRGVFFFGGDRSPDVDRTPKARTWAERGGTRHYPRWLSGRRLNGKKTGFGRQCGHAVDLIPYRERYRIQSPHFQQEGTSCKVRALLPLPSRAETAECGKKICLCANIRSTCAH